MPRAVHEKTIATSHRSHSARFVSSADAGRRDAFLARVCRAGRSESVRRSCGSRGRRCRRSRLAHRPPCRAPRRSPKRRAPRRVRASSTQAVRNRRTRSRRRTNADAKTRTRGWLRDRVSFDVGSSRRRARSSTLGAFSPEARSPPRARRRRRSRPRRTGRRARSRRGARRDARPDAQASHHGRARSVLRSLSIRERLDRPRRIGWKAAAEVVSRLPPPDRAFRGESRAVLSVGFSRARNAPATSKSKS